MEPEAHGPAGGSRQSAPLAQSIAHLQPSLTSSLRALQKGAACCTGRYYAECILPTSILIGTSTSVSNDFGSTKPQPPFTQIDCRPSLLDRADLSAISHCCEALKTQAASWLPKKRQDRPNPLRRRRNLNMASEYRALKICLMGRGVEKVWPLGGFFSHPLLTHPSLKRPTAHLTISLSHQDKKRSHSQGQGQEGICQDQGKSG